MLELSLSRSTGARRAPSLFTRISQAMTLRKQRRELAELPDALLEDIGYTRAEANQEAKRPLWDVPCHWTR